MSQLRSFAPWIAYPAASALFGWQAGAAVALGFCIVGLARDGRAAATDTFRMAALVFFAALSAVAYADPATRAAPVRARAHPGNARGRGGGVDRRRPAVHRHVREAGRAPRVLGHAALRPHQRGAHRSVGHELRDHRRDHRDHAHGRTPRRRRSCSVRRSPVSSCRCASPAGTRPRPAPATPSPNQDICAPKGAIR